MTEDIIRRAAGLSGLLSGALTLLVVPLYFLYSGPPPAWDVLTRGLLDLVMLVAFVPFVLGLRRLLKAADPVLDWVTAVGAAAAQLYVAIALVATSLEMGVSFFAQGGRVDPTTEGPLAAGAVLLHGSIGRALTALFLAAMGYAALRNPSLPRWVGRSAYVIALINIVFLPSLYFGTDAARFYSALGWGNTALTASLVAFWAGATGILLLRKSNDAIIEAWPSRTSPSPGV